MSFQFYTRSTYAINIRISFHITFPVQRGQEQTISILIFICRCSMSAMHHLAKTTSICMMNVPVEKMGMLCAQWGGDTTLVSWENIYRILNEKPPKLALEVMDTCVGQNKNQTTIMFDSMLSLLLYHQVANLYLPTGHSHMKADQTTALCKKSLAKNDLYIPDQIRILWIQLPICMLISW